MNSAKCCKVASVLHLRVCRTQLQISSEFITPVAPPFTILTFSYPVTKIKTVKNPLSFLKIDSLYLQPQVIFGRTWGNRIPATSITRKRIHVTAASVWPIIERASVIRHRSASHKSHWLQCSAQETWWLYYPLWTAVLLLLLCDHRSCSAWERGTGSSSRRLSTTRCPSRAKV